MGGMYSEERTTHQTAWRGEKQTEHQIECHQHYLQRARLSVCAYRLRRISVVPREFESVEGPRCSTSLDLEKLDPVSQIITLQVSSVSKKDSASSSWWCVPQTVRLLAVAHKEEVSGLVHSPATGMQPTEDALSVPVLECA